MKKEVIYFDAAAYGPFAKCELINGYLESDYKNMDEEAFCGGKKIELTELTPSMLFIGRYAAVLVFARIRVKEVPKTILDSNLGF
jgi:hypothetical protein|tara:strand:+ start:94 stop:348 length:255 start_codon:yes stop_codon:yes gene_type:complete